ncbi:hypothetical protein LguiB_001659 [Lonicera macranthoides]
MNLVEFNGDVLLAKSCGQNEWDVFRFDGKERGWVKQKGLGDTALFIGCTSYLRPAIGDSADLADSIFSHYDYSNLHGTVTETRFYSLKGDDHYKQNQAYDWMLKDSLDRIWIEPPY